MIAIVIFHGEGKHCLNWLLKSGFQHCAVVLESGDNYIFIDPKNGLPQIQVVSESELNDRLGDPAFITLTVETEEFKTEGPFMLNNCVGLVKKIIGISDPFIITPYQLWRHLNVKTNLTR